MSCTLNPRHNVPKSYELLLCPQGLHGGLANVGSASSPVCLGLRCLFSPACHR